MQGYQLTLFAQENRNHGSLPLGEWFVQEARKLDFGRTTMIAASEGFGHGHKLRSAHFFELADPPIEVTMALGGAGAEWFFHRLREEKINTNYVKPLLFCIFAHLVKQNGLS